MSVVTLGNGFDNENLVNLSPFTNVFQLPLLEKGDIIIDGGNSEYRDTNVSIVLENI